MSVQTSVTDRFSVAIPGETRGSGYQTHARIATAALTPGLFVVQGATDNKCKVPAAAADVAKGLGVALSAVNRDPNFGVASAGYIYQAGAEVDICYRGQVWVTVEEAVGPMDPVYVRHTARLTNTTLGAFRKDADTSSSVDYAAVVTGARYLTTALAGGLALVDLNLPQ